MLPAAVIGPMGVIFGPTFFLKRAEAFPSVLLFLFLCILLPSRLPSRSNMLEGVALL